MKVAISLLFLSLNLLATDVHVAWDRPADYLTLKCYNLWVGTNNTEFGYYVPVQGNTNTNAILILDVDTTYWVGVESVSTNGMISAMSDILVIIPPAKPQNLHIIIEQGHPGGVWTPITNYFDVAVFPVEETNLFFRAKLQLQ